jgi:hypothetical protein
VQEVFMGIAISDCFFRSKAQKAGPCTLVQDPKFGPGRIRMYFDKVFNIKELSILSNSAEACFGATKVMLLRFM